MKYTVRAQKKHVFEIDRKADFNSVVTINSGKEELNIRLEETNSDGSIRTVRVNDRLYSVNIERRSDGFPNRVLLDGIPFPVEIEKVESTRYRPPAAPKQINGEVRAELPGQVRSVLVEVGSMVQKGQSILILEAMKMENEVLSPKDGKISAIHAAPGKLVMRGDLMLEVD